MSNKRLFGEEVLEVLFARSGMTFVDLCKYFFQKPALWPHHMSLIDCLRALCGANLIKVDGIQDEDIREFIALCEFDNKWNKFHSTGASPKHNKFRSSEEWRLIRGALTEGMQSQRSICFPIFGKPANLGEWSPDIFVLMPFSQSMASIYADCICVVAKKLGLTIKRADQFSTSNPIMLDIWSAIWRARVVIADCTHRNPNVFYEIGIAHTIGRDVILIAQDPADVPFDIGHIRYIVYSDDRLASKHWQGSLKSRLRCA